MKYLLSSPYNLELNRLTYIKYLDIDKNYTFHYSPFDYIYSAIIEGGIDYKQKLVELKENQLKYQKQSDKMDNTHFTVSHIAEFDYFMFGHDTELCMGHTKDELKQIFNKECEYEILIDNNYIDMLYEESPDKLDTDVNVELHKFWNNIIKSLHKYELYDILNTFSYVVIDHKDDKTQFKIKDIFSEPDDVTIVAI